MIRWSNVHDGKPIGWKVSQRMKDFSNILNKKIFDSWFFGLLNTLLYGFIDIVYKLILVFDALDDPVIHFVHQHIKVAIILQIVFFYTLSYLLDLLLQFFLSILYELVENRLYLFNFLYFELILFFYINNKILASQFGRSFKHSLTCFA